MSKYDNNISDFINNMKVDKELKHGIACYIQSDLSQLGIDLPDHIRQKYQDKFSEDLVIEVFDYMLSKLPDTTKSLPSNASSEGAGRLLKDEVLELLKYIGKDGLYLNEDGTLWKDAFLNGTDVTEETINSFLMKSIVFTNNQPTQKAHFLNATPAAESPASPAAQNFLEEALELILKLEGEQVWNDYKQIARRGLAQHRYPGRSGTIHTANSESPPDYTAHFKDEQSFIDFLKWQKGEGK